MLWKRALGIFFLAWAIALVIASLTSLEWVDNTDTSGQINGSKYYLGLRKWKRVDAARAVGLDDSEHDYNSNQWPGTFLGSQDTWKQAGLAALALGAIGVIFEISAFLSGVVDIITKKSMKVPVAIAAFMGGACIVLGAIIYEGIRPAFHGDMGYNWPLGVYLTSSILSTLCALLFWWSDDKY